jgi:hypothetical protein
LGRRQEQKGEPWHVSCEDEIEAGVASQNATVQPDFRLAMSSNDRPEPTVDDSVLAGEKSACVALVPVVPSLHWSGVPDQRLSRADFVTQLIATAEHVPQTRSLRRASPADAKAAYGARWHRGPVQDSGGRTRQIV